MNNDDQSLRDAGINAEVERRESELRDLISSAAWSPEHSPSECEIDRVATQAADEARREAKDLLKRVGDRKRSALYGLSVVGGYMIGAVAVTALIVLSVWLVSWIVEALPWPE